MTHPVPVWKSQEKKTLTVQRGKQNKSYDSGKRSQKYHEEKQKSQKLSNKIIPMISEKPSSNSEAGKCAKNMVNMNSYDSF